MDDADPRRHGMRVVVAALAVGVGLTLLLYAWIFTFRDYMDSPVWVYAAFSAPAWIVGMILVVFGVRGLSNRAGRSR